MPDNKVAGLAVAVALLLSCSGEAAPRPARQSTADMIYDVDVVAQSKTNDCWAAAAAMLVSWKTHISTSPLALATTAGSDFVRAYRSDSGLFGQDVARFAAALHLRVEPPQNLSAAGYAAMLRSHGPLWIGTAIFSPSKIYRHVRIVTGIDTGNRLHLIDPDGGRIYAEPVDQFARELETIAKQDLGVGTDLRPQIIHNN